MFQKPKGTQDLLPGVIEKWQYIENKARDLCRRFQYKEIRTPIFEQTELFQRSVGETTDVVEKEMYTFEDKGKRSMTLRPEGTAGVVRSYLENKLYADPDVSKLYYIGPMFRYEQPQAGRYRQLHQFGVEAFGGKEPALDAEIIAMGFQFYKELGITGVTVELNSVGNHESRDAYKNQLRESLLPIREKLCADCQSRFERNIMRVLDCKVDQAHFTDVPSILDSLDEESRTHFDAVKDALTAMDIPYAINPRLVRGLDYYSHTAFEYKAAGIGAIDTIGGGGRYDGLVQQLGNQSQPGIGFGIGLERTVLILEHQGIEVSHASAPDLYLVTLGDEAKKAAAPIVMRLRQSGLAVDTDYQGRKIKAQLKSAVRAQARYAGILGDEELQRGEIVLKDLHSETQQTVSLADLATHIAPPL